MRDAFILHWLAIDSSEIAFKFCNMLCMLLYPKALEWWSEYIKEKQSNVMQLSNEFCNIFLVCPSNFVTETPSFFIDPEIQLFRGFSNTQFLALWPATGTG